MRSKAIFLVSAFVVAGLLGGVTASSVAAARSTTVTWNVSSLTAGQVKSLSAIATTNSTGVKTWSKTGSCTLTPKSKPTKLTMGTGQSCTLTLKIAKSGNYSAKTSTTTITRKPYRVGHKGPGGGTIFYVDLTRAAGSQYFEVACAGWSDGTCVASDMNVDPTAVWGCESTPVPGGPNDYWSTRDRTAIGDGEQNTTDIVNGCPESGIAAKVADALVLGGKDDWFLPSKDELNALCKWAFEDIVNAVCAGGRTYVPTRNGGFNAGPFWSSSEAEVWSAWAQNFVDGIQYDDYGKMNAALYVRPVRSF